jgi:putative membrane protein insertion efficiency factor
MRLWDLPAKGIIGILWVHKNLISPVLPRACRFEPTCSEYAMGALEHHGLLRGVGLAVKRVLRCHPLGGSGFDPVP